jgi:uncharacterized protein YkwD
MYLVFHRMAILAAATLALAGCAAMDNPIPAVVEIASRFEPVFLLQPSNTPFLPARDTPTATPTDPPTATPEPADTETHPAVIPWTATSTNTVVVLPSVTPVTPKVYPAPTKTLQPPKVYPKATLKVKTAAPAATEKPAGAEEEQFVPAATETPAPTATAEQAVATETLATEAATLASEAAPYPPPEDGEADPSAPESTATLLPPSPTASPAPSPTRTPLPTATRTSAPVVPSIGCATFNYEWEAQVADLLNQERAKNGLPAWRVNSILTNTARAHSVDMVVNKFMSHTGSDGRTPKQRIAQAGFIGGWWGEIIAGGNPTIAVNWWMNEPGHRAQIINTHYTDFGVGYAYCPGQGWFTVDQGGP